MPRLKYPAGLDLNFDHPYFVKKFVYIYDGSAHLRRLNLNIHCKGYQRSEDKRCHYSR